jgi:hypothetical protein
MAIEVADEVRHANGPDLEQIFSSSPAAGGQLVISGETTCSSSFVATWSFSSSLSFSYSLIFANMSETFQELADIPKDFVREGSQFVRRCTKRMFMLIGSHFATPLRR